MKVLPILFTLILLSVTVCEKVAYQEELKMFIQKELPYKESNPIHTEDNESVTRLFNAALHRNGDQEKLRAKLFQSLYDNAYSEYEDSNDARRMKCKRALIFAAIALTAHEESQQTF